jgi:sarcosine oxidase subunit gamma
MAESGVRREPFDGLAVISVRNRLAIEIVPPAARFSLRGPPSAAAAVGRAFGLAALPTEQNRAASDGQRIAFCLGPDEWLLLGPPGEGIDMAGVSEPCSLVDISHRNAGLTLSGSLATDILATGVMLDLHPSAFPVGMATRTLFVKAEIVLWRRGPEAFHLELWRSFAPYMHGLLVEAALEFAKG